MKYCLGVIQIIPLLIIALVLGAFLIFYKGGIVSLKTNSPSPSPEASIIASAEPSLSPSPLPSSKPSPTVKPSPTPKPSPAAVSGPPGAGLSTITVQTEKGNFKATVLSIDLNSARVITDTASDSDCGDNCPVLSLMDYVNRNGGFAGVNGTYFCPQEYPECASKKNSFDFSVYNTRLGKWINEGMLSWGGRAMVYFEGGGAYYQQNAGHKGGITAGIVNYPGLLSGGAVQIDDNQSGLSDKQKAKGTKVGIGVRGNKNVMVVVASNANMQDFAYIFKSLGADGALNLDDGGSTALINGGYIYGPGRALPNAIIFAR